MKITWFQAPIAIFFFLLFDEKVCTSVDNKSIDICPKIQILKPLMRNALGKIEMYFGAPISDEYIWERQQCVQKRRKGKGTDFKVL